MVGSFHSRLLALILLLLLCGSFVHADRTDGEVHLTPGVHQQGTVLEGQVDPFVLTPVPVLSPDERLLLVVTSFSGDADLYVSLTPGAGPGNHVWNSSLATTDSVILGVDDIEGVGALYIGVHGYSNASYTVLAFASNSHVNLTDGMPQIAQGRLNSYTYFSFPLIGAQNFSITVTPISGDPDLYVSTSIPFPSADPGQYTWVAKEFGFDMIDILTTDPDFVENTIYYIAVHSFAETMFALTVSTWNTTTTIVERVPISEDVVTEGYMYFKFLLSVVQDVIFTLTPISSGDPDMFVSRDNERPTKENHTWSSIEPGIDTVLVPISDPDFGLGWYYIGISGWQEADFQLLAATQGASIVLVDGVPQNMVQPTGTFSYFRFVHEDMEAGLDFVISSVKVGSSVNAFMSRSVTHPSAQPGKHDMLLLNVTSSGAIELDPLVPVGTYYYGVEAISGVNGLTNFTLHVSTEVAVQILQEDILSDYNTVPAGHYRYFVFDFLRRPDTEERDDLTISLQVHDNEGDADLYVGTDPSRLPSRDYYLWKSTRAGSDSVTIVHTDPNYISGRYFIAVHGFDRTGFSVIAFRSSTTTDAIEGVTYSGTVSKDHYVFYKFLMTATGSLTITLRAAVPGGDPDLYISTLNVKPNKHDYQWESISIGDGSVTIEEATWGWYYIGVYGASNFTAFEMKASHDYLNILQGYAITDFVAAGNYKRYRMNLASGITSTSLSTTLISGITELYVFSNATENDFDYPNRTHYDLHSTSYPGNAILSFDGDSHFASSATWLISVYSPNDTDYFIGAIYDHGSLLPGVPMLGISAQQHPTYYTFWIGASVAQDFHIILDVLEGDVVLVVEDDGFPTLTSFNWTADGSDRLYIHIGKEEISRLSLFISVFSRTPQSTFILNVAGDNDSTYLLHDQAAGALTSTGSYSYFYVSGTREPHDMRIQVESCEHKQAPQFFVSTTIEKPDEHTGNSSHSSGSFRTIFDSVAMPFAAQYVGVKGTDSAYSIKAITTNYGVPQPPNGGALQSKTLTESGQTLTQIIFSSGATPSDPLLFRIYLLRVPEGVDAAGFNLATICSIEKAGTLITTLNDTSGGEISFTFNSTTIASSSKHSYIANVIALNKMGLRAAYEPLLIEGHKHNPRSEFPWLIGILIVMTLLIVLALSVIVLAAVLIAIKVVEMSKKKSRASGSSGDNMYYSKLDLTTAQQSPANLRENLVTQQLVEQGEDL